ncbi:MAG: ATP-binding cassette domain-containing protein [Saprospiraceae bacterium]|nr:ATP-binding cassette domain-containing protein [Candidatus Defluviibacterium haderslevense]
MKICYSHPYSKGEHQTIAIQNIKQLMHDIDLNIDLFNREVSSLSGGQKQRVAFVRSLIVESEVLFADEPTGNLDPLTSRKMMRLLKNEIVKHNRTALIVSHDIHLAMEFADIIVPIKLKNIENGDKDGCYFVRRRYSIMINNNGKITKALL